MKTYFVKAIPETNVQEEMMVYTLSTGCGTVGKCNSDGRCLFIKYNLIVKNVLPVKGSIKY